MFPAACSLVACSNPCPCGRPVGDCRCTEFAKARYARRLSAPLLDRFDLRLRITGPGAADRPGEDSATVRARVLEAVDRQRARFTGTRWRWNREIPAGAIEQFAGMAPAGLDAWQAVVEDGLLTGRGAARVRRVARTIADLAGTALIEAEHVVLASSLRQDVP